MTIIVLLMLSSGHPDSQGVTCAKAIGRAYCAIHVRDTRKEGGRSYLTGLQAPEGPDATPTYEEIAKRILPTLDQTGDWMSAVMARNADRMWILKNADAEMRARLGDMLEALAGSRLEPGEDIRCLGDQKYDDPRLSSVVKGITRARNSLGSTQSRDATITLRAFRITCLHVLALAGGRPDKALLEEATLDSFRGPETTEQEQILILELYGDPLIPVECSQKSLGEIHACLSRSSDLVVLAALGALGKVGSNDSFSHIQKVAPTLVGKDLHLEDASRWTILKIKYRLGASTQKRAVLSEALKDAYVPIIMWAADRIVEGRHSGFVSPVFQARERYRTNGYVFDHLSRAHVELRSRRKPVGPGYAYLGGIVGLVMACLLCTLLLIQRRSV